MRREHLRPPHPSGLDLVASKRGLRMVSRWFLVANNPRPHADVLRGVTSPAVALNGLPGVAALRRYFSRIAESVVSAT